MKEYSSASKLPDRELGELAARGLAADTESEHVYSLREERKALGLLLTQREADLNLLQQKNDLDIDAMGEVSTQEGKQAQAKAEEFASAERNLKDEIEVIRKQYEQRGTELERAEESLRAKNEAYREIHKL